MPEEKGGGPAVVDGGSGYGGGGGARAGVKKNDVEEAGLLATSTEKVCVSYDTNVHACKKAFLLYYLSIPTCYSFTS
jgi:hypothetical protein